MELSYFLAQLMGISLVIFSVAGILHPATMIAAVRDFKHESFPRLSLGFITLAAGLAVILSHNVWDGTWRVLITLFGWSAFLKGITYLYAPDVLVNMSKGLLKDASWARGAFFAALLLGGYLAYKGFGY